MIAKNIKGKSFGGTVRYVMNDGHELIAAEGVFAEDVQSIIRSFAIQRFGRPEIKQPVGHIPISFSPEDSPRLTNDFLVRLAGEYMEAMGIRNTQFIIVRHHNTDHPHIHIVYNRIDNDLKLISVNNDYKRNIKVCKKLKNKYGLTYGKGKDKVRREKLSNPDKVKYEIYDTIKDMLPYCNNYRGLEDMLGDFDINVQYKYRRGAEETEENIQGVSFRMNGIAFKGSDIDRKFSHANLQKTFEENRNPKQLTPEEQRAIDEFDISKYLPNEQKSRERPVSQAAVASPQESPHVERMPIQSAPPPVPTSKPEATTQPKSTPRNPRVGGVELTNEQTQILKDGGYIYLENMHRSSGVIASGYVVVDFPTKRVFHFSSRPDEFVKYGKYEMREMDKRRIEAGLVVRATVKWYDGRTACPYLWKENPADTEYKESWSDPRTPRQAEALKTLQKEHIKPPAPKSAEAPKREYIKPLSSKKKRGFGM